MGRKDSKYVLKLDHLRSTYIFLNSARRLVIGPFFQYLHFLHFASTTLTFSVKLATLPEDTYVINKTAMFSSIPASLT